jgi:hypothetical protein
MWQQKRKNEVSWNYPPNVKLPDNPIDRYTAQIQNNPHRRKTRPIFPSPPKQPISCLRAERQQDTVGKKMNGEKMDRLATPARTGIQSPIFLVPRSFNRN